MSGQRIVMKGVFCGAISLLVLFSFCRYGFAIFIERQVRIAEELPDATSQGGQEDLLSRPRIEYGAYGLRDPFERFIKPIDEEQARIDKEEEPDIRPGLPERLPSLVVKGLVWGGERPQAIINDKVVGIGDIIEQVEITNIDKYGVTVRYNQRIYRLSSPASVYMNKGVEEEEE